MSTPDKNIVIIIRSPPHSTLNAFEALRTAAGLTDHRLRILWAGDGVYSALDSVDQRLTATLLADLPSLVDGFYADAESLRVRGLENAKLLPHVKILSKPEVNTMITDAQATLAY
jgi:sulfur relay (sulfurtransferase) DsrF/TusC family protein